MTSLTYCLLPSFSHHQVHNRENLVRVGLAAVSDLFGLGCGKDDQFNFHVGQRGRLRSTWKRGFHEKDNGRLDGDHVGSNYRDGECTNPLRTVSWMCGRATKPNHINSIEVN